MESRIAAIWARVSDPKQEKYSPEGQVKRVKVKLEELGYIPQHIFQVTWTSTDLKPCPQFQELGQLIRNRKIQAVAMLDRDRIEANGLQRLNFLANCKENGVEVIVCQGVPFVEGGEGQLVELALALAKEKQVQRAQSGAKQGLEDRARQKNLPPTKTKVYGYEWRDGRFVPDDNTENVRLIWQSVLSGKTLDSICRELVFRGIPTPLGKIYWGRRTIHAMLKNPIYAGRVGTLKYEKVEPKSRKGNTFGKTSARLKPMEEWHFIDGLVEQSIITWEQFMQVQQRLRLNQEHASRNAKHDYLLRGMINCELCSARGLHRTYYGIQRGNEKPFYACSTGWKRVYGKQCESKFMQCDNLEEQVKAKIRNFLESPEFYFSGAEDEVELRKKTIADIEQNIRDNERGYRKTIDDERYKLAKLTPEAFEQEQKLLIARRNYLKEENERLKVKVDNLRQHSVNEDMVRHLRNNLMANLDGATTEDWRFILESLEAKILAFGDGTWDIEINIPVEKKMPPDSIMFKTPYNPPSPRGGGILYEIARKTSYSVFLS